MYSKKNILYKKKTILKNCLFSFVMCQTVREISLPLGIYFR